MEIENCAPAFSVYFLFEYRWVREGQLRNAVEDFITFFAFIKLCYESNAFFAFIIPFFQK